MISVDHHNVGLPTAVDEYNQGFKTIVPICKESASSGTAGTADKSYTQSHDSRLMAPSMVVKLDKSIKAEVGKLSRATTSRGGTRNLAIISAINAHAGGGENTIYRHVPGLRWRLEERCPASSLSLISLRRRYAGIKSYRGYQLRVHLR